MAIKSDIAHGDQPSGYVNVDVESPRNRVGFVFTTRDRVSLTLRSLASMDSERGYDIIWVDGSTTNEGRQLPRDYRFENASLKEVHFDIKGGPDVAIAYGLQRLLDLGYDYCGLVENDIIFRLGWYRKLLELFHLAALDNLTVGAATVRNYRSRVIDYRSRYTINWCIGAGMVLFSKEAAKIILARYPKLYSVRALKVCRFYAERFGVDLSKVWDLWHGSITTILVPDWAYSMTLQEHGLASVGSIPSLAYDLGVDVEGYLKTSYVELQDSDKGIAHPLIKRRSLWSIRIVDSMLSLIPRRIPEPLASSGKYMLHLGFPDIKEG